MTTPFDEVIEHIKSVGYHDHRSDAHSNIVSNGIIRDLKEKCPPLAEDIDSGRIRHWFNETTPGARGRRIDLLMGEPLADGTPDLKKVRICVENKSVITAHRNKDARFDDLNEMLQVIHGVSPAAIIVATVPVGLNERCLNVSDRVKPFVKDFDTAVLGRLSKGDASLWEEFPAAVSRNRLDDPEKTVAKFKHLQTRPPGQTHILGYDYIIIVPVMIDNVDPPSIPLRNGLGIDVEKEYRSMLSQICKAYKSRW